MTTLLNRIWDKRNVIVIIVLMNLIYFFSYFQRIAIPGTIFNEVQSDLNLTSVQVAFLGSIYLYIYSGMQFFNGVLVDRIGTAKVIIAGGVLLSIGSVLFPLSHSLITLYFSRAIIGFGASVMFLCLVKELDIQVSPHNFTAALSVSLLIGYSGGLMGTKPLAIAIDSFGWRPSLLAVGIACSTVVFVSFFFLRKLMKRPTQFPVIMPISALKMVISNPLTYPPIISSSIIFSVYFVMQSTIGKKFLEDCCHIKSEKAASYTFIMMLSAIIMSSIIGFIPKLIANRRKPIMISINILNISAITMAIFIARGNSHLIIPCFITWGMSASGTPIYLTTVKELNEPKYMGTSSGFYNSFCYLAVAMVVTLSGYILDLYSKGAVKTATAIHYSPDAYVTIFICTLFLGFVSFISTFFVRETAGKNINT